MNRNNWQDKAIVFDLGGVLIDWNPRYLYRGLFTDEAAMEDFLAHVCTQEWNAEQDAGRTFEEAIREQIAKFPEHEAFIRAYRERWTDMVGGAIAGTVEILDQLRKNNYLICALSNWSAETFPYARDRFPFLQWFETIVLSGEEKIIKPDPRVFHILLQRIHRQASDCIYIDDTEANFQAARELGFAAIHFKSPPQLRSELQRLGIALR